ncbi:neogenin-like [Epargyreus clarus]|uniref:neogenin-like n=1 Tax=Epargyreus clarus TaxID=520877 RepID=UPI003C2C3570
MALILLQVLVLGVTAAAVDDVPITWHSSRAALPCVVQRRPPPPLLDEDRSRSKPYVWRRGDTEFSSKRISPNGTLEVTKKREGEGVYQCGVRHHGRLVLGNPINLKFAYMDKQFTVHPANGTARAGQPAVLTCTIYSGPNATISWERDGKPLPQDARYHILANELIIIDVKREDTGLYRCKATNPYLNRVPASHAGKLLVEESTTQEVSFLEVHHEGNITAARGSRVVLPCPVLGWPRPKLIWTLTPPGDGRTSELEPTDEILVLSNLEYDQEGLYSCSVEGRSDLAKSFNVTLTEPVKITLPPSSKEALRASTVRFNCTATGRPEPIISWYKDGQPLIPLGRFNLRNSIDRKRIELVISGVTSDDAGIYQCFASNPVSVSSGWAQLSVRGAPAAAAPTAVACAPVDPRRVEVRWRPAAAHVAAYTVDVTPRDKAGGALTGQPHLKTEEVVTVRDVLTPYFFQVRAFIPVSSNETLNWRGVASDMSERVVCQGQGIPFRLIKLDDEAVLVSWKQFSEQNPGVAQWILQYKARDDSEEHNVTLDASIYNYTLHAPPSAPLLVRVLGSLSLDWLHQNLSLVAWSSTTAAGQDLDDGDIMVVPDDIYAEEVTPHSFTIKWQVEGDADRYSYMVCVRKVGNTEDCKESFKTSASIEGLEPDSDYEVRIQARLPGRALGGPFSLPVQITTQYEGSLRFKDLTYKFVNLTTLQVSWSGEAGRYTVNHSAQLKLPVEQWAAVETERNTVLIHGIDPLEQTFVMVTGYSPLEHSQILNIPAQMKDLEASELQYAYTLRGVRVWWGAAGSRVVRYAQNITRPVERWRSRAVDTASVELTDLDPSLPVYVMVTVTNRSKHNQMLTIPPRPPNYLHFYLGVGVGGGLCALWVLAVAAVCVWRRRKRANTPVRSRRRTSGNDTIEEEGAEMKCVGTSSRLANGAVREAGEPLLNGHVHITENPASKTPNGRTRRARRYEAFDVSRHVDSADSGDSTLDTTACSLLDTSRRPEHASYNKLPDDNMNSQLNTDIDNSKIQPTLQPNG